MKSTSCAWRSLRTARSSLSLLLGLLALTACGSLQKPKAPPPMPVRPAVEIPATIASPCTRSERPNLPPPGSLDVAKPTELTREALEAVWAAYVARGLWIAQLSGFSIRQEGDVARCDAARAGAVDALRAATDSARSR